MIRATSSKQHLRTQWWSRMVVQGTILGCSWACIGCHPNVFKASLANGQAASEAFQYSESDSGQMALEKALEQSRVKSVYDFLSSKEAQNTYYEAARHYYGANRFDRGCYDSVVRELASVLNGAHPQRQVVADELWKKPESMGVFHIPVALKSYGLNADLVALRAAVLGLLAELSLAAGELAHMASLKEATGAMQETLTGLEQELQDKMKSIEGLTKKNQKGASAKIFAEVASSARSRQIAAFVAREALLESSLLDSNVLGDTDSFIEEYRKFYEKIQDNADTLGITYPGFNQTLGTLVKPLKEFTGNPALFFKQENLGAKGAYPTGKRASANIIHFPVLRKFHAVFKSITNSECTRNDSGRWGTILMTGSQLYYVEQKGSFIGFVELAGVGVADEKGQATGQIVYSPTFGARYLGEPINVLREDGTLVQDSGYHLWLREVLKRLPANAIGIGKSNSTVASNSGAGLTTAMQSPTYDKATPVRSEQGGLVLDERTRLMAEILKTSQTSGRTYSRPEWFFITDLIENSASNWRLLDGGKLPTPKDFKFNAMKDALGGSDCKAFSQGVFQTRLLSGDEILYIVDCFARLLDANSKNQSRDYFLSSIIQNFARMAQAIEYEDEAAYAALSKPSSVALFKLVFDRLVALNDTSATMPFARAGAIMFAWAAPREVALDFIRHVLGSARKEDLHGSMSKIFRAMTERETREQMFLNQQQDHSNLDEMARIERIENNL